MPHALSQLPLLLLALLAACSAQPEPAPTLSRAQLLDPATCATCHPDQYRDWLASAHAHAAEDPVFLAMNRRGQRETSGALGNFCMQCHAPMAVREGATKDGLNLEQLPPAMRGVTCYFCHSVQSVDGTHNNPLQLSTDLLLRGPIANPLANTAHRSEYSTLHDRDRLESAKLCGACHDVVTPAGASLERTLIEWQASVFSHAPGGTTCSQCHMPQSSTPRPIASVPGAPLRRTHGHQFPGADVPTGTDAQAASQAIQALLDTTVQSAVCVTTSGAPHLEVILDNVAAGHSFPSGASLDRRLWVEIIAYQAGQPIYQSGTALPGDPSAANDSDLWLLRDCIRDAAGQPVHMFWQAAQASGNALPGQATFDPSDPRYYQTHVLARFPQTGALAALPDRVTVRVRLQAIGLDMLDSLVQSGDLDPAVRDAMPTWQLGKTLEWTPASATKTFTRDGVTRSCATHTNLDPAADTVPATRLPCAP